MVNEEARLAALEACGLLDTPPDADFDALAQLAATVCDTPVSAVSLVDRDRVFLKARHGIDATEILRNGSFCGRTVELRERLLVPDTHERFRDSPLVTGGPKFRFYAGYPLVLETGEILGSLCVLDYERRDGSTFHGSLVLQCHKTKAGAVEFFSGMVRDVTDQRATERTLRLREDELRQAKKVEAVGKLASGIAHEFNNLLTAIGGFAS
jgi:C4-dicarboxylate-specific signal transduction histidine kinase